MHARNHIGAAVQSKPRARLRSIEKYTRKGCVETQRILASSYALCCARLRIRTSFGQNLRSIKGVRTEPTPMRDIRLSHGAAQYILQLVTPFHVLRTKSRCRARGLQALFKCQKEQNKHVLRRSSRSSVQALHKHDHEIFDARLRRLNLTAG